VGLNMISVLMNIIDLFIMIPANKLKIHNLTQKQLAEILDVSTTTVKRWEYCKAYPRLKSFKTFLKLIKKDYKNIPKR